MLCAMISHVMKLRVDEQHSVIRAAVLHDIGQLRLPIELIGKNDLNEEEKGFWTICRRKGSAYWIRVYTGDTSVKRICAQCYRCIRDFRDGKRPDMRISTEARVMAVAQTYDQMTAMQFGQNPASEVAAIRHLLDHPEVYDEKRCRR